MPHNLDIHNFMMFGGVFSMITHEVLLRCLRVIRRSGASMIFVLTIVLLASCKTDDFNLAVKDATALFIEKRGLRHRGHEVVRAVRESSWAFSAALANKLAKPFLRLQSSPSSPSTSSTTLRPATKAMPGSSLRKLLQPAPLNDDDEQAGDHREEPRQPSPANRPPPRLRGAVANEGEPDAVPAVAQPAVNDDVVDGDELILDDDDLGIDRSRGETWQH